MVGIQKEGVEVAHGLCAIVVKRRWLGAQEQALLKGDRAFYYIAEDCVDALCEEQIFRRQV